MSRIAIGGVALALGLMLLPSPAAAQGSSAASITGVAKDSSGAVLPGVTVEASSPAMIEKVRSTVTDGRGEYRIIELRPGLYSVTFTLPGFNVYKRDGLELSPNFTATVNAEMKVGGVEETITVTGATPLIDVQNVAQQVVIPKALMDAVPTAKSMLGVAALMPAVITPPNAQDVGGTKGEQSVRISVHGGKTNDSRLMQDGMLYNNMTVEGTGRGYYVNPLQMTQTVIDTGSGGNAQYALGGAAVNSIPRDGGNVFNGIAFFAYSNDRFQSDNFDQKLKDQNLTSVNTLRQVYDFNGLFGGPIMKDRLWFMGSIRRSGNTNRVANLYHALDQNSWLFTPQDGLSGPTSYGTSTDFTRPFNPAEPLENLKTQSVRLASQVTSKDKVTFHYELQRNIRDQLTGQLDRGTTAIEANGSYCTPTDELQWTWTRPQNNKVLFEAGLALHRGSFGTTMGSDAHSLSDYTPCGSYFLPDRVLINDAGYGFTYHGVGARTHSEEHNNNGRVSMSYVTGRHNFKVGMSFIRTLLTETGAIRNPTDTGGLPLSYSFRSGVPQSLTEFVTPSLTETQTRDVGIFVQDQWDVSRVTLSGGLRFDYNRQYAPAFDRPAGFTPFQHFDATECTPCWKDLSPRLGVAWDVTGDSKTAVKFGLNRYVQAATNGVAGMFAPQATTISFTTRSWNDTFYPVGDPRRGNFFPDCDLHASAANQECGAMATPTFGSNVITRDPNDPVSKNWLNGWQRRAYSWQMSMSIDRQFLPGLAIGAGFYRTWFGNFSLQDDLNRKPSDYDEYCVTAPTDARLGADISGHEICGLFDLNRAVFGQVARSVVTLTSSINPLTGKPYGDQQETYKGGDVSVAARFKHINLNGGWNIGNAIQTGIIAGGTTSSSTDNCFVVDSPQQLYQCHVNNPYQSRFKVSGSFPLFWDIQAALVYQNLPSINYGGSRSFSTSTGEVHWKDGTSHALGSGGTAVTVQLIPPFQAFVDDRINQMDFRASKIIRLGGKTRLQANFDLYNLFNVSTVVGVNNTYQSAAANGGTWLQPTQIIDARLGKISLQFDF